MQKEPITGEGPKCVLSPEARHWKKGLLRAVPLRHSRLAKPWTIHLCLRGQLKRAVSDETTSFHNGALEKGGVFIFG